MTDESGDYSGYDRLAVRVDASQLALRIGKVAIPLAEITDIEVRPLPRAKGRFLAIDVRGPSINDHEPTTVRLIHANFFNVTKDSAMQAVVDEVKPLIQTGAASRCPPPSEQVAPLRRIQAQYALNVSLLITYHRKLWYSFDRPGAVVAKTLLLMLLNGTVNVLGVLLVAVPFDNYRLSRTLVRLGWSRALAMTAFVLSSMPAYAFWASSITRLIIAKE